MTVSPDASCTKVQSTQHRFQALDSLRGICACMVVLLHFKTSGIISNNNFVEHGHRFVDFFFVLSGFVISASYGERLSGGFSIGRFMFLRWGRIYPLHLFVLMIFVLFEVGFALIAPGYTDRRPFTGGNQPIGIIYNLFLVQIFFGNDSSTWNSPSWSIAAEFWVYLLFAVIFKYFRSSLVKICIFLSVTSCAILLSVTDRYLNVFHTGALERCIYGFATGVVAFQIFKLRVAEKIVGISFYQATVFEIIDVLVVIVAVTFIGGGPWSFAIPCIFGLTVIIFSMERGAISKFLLTRPLLLLGTLSYSIYMVHQLIYYRILNVLSLIGRLTHHNFVVKVNGAHEVGESPIFGDVMSLLMLMLSISVAALTYNLIERPARNWTRRNQSWMSWPLKYI